MMKKSRAVTRQVERAIEMALMPGRFISYNASAKQGRGGEALSGAWDEYREHPDRYAYADLMKYVPKAQRVAWHEKAMEAAMRIVNAKKSKYYETALSNFERSRRCFERAGLVVEWARVVKKVRADHQRNGVHGRIRGDRGGFTTEPQAIVPPASKGALGVISYSARLATLSTPTVREDVRTGGGGNAPQCAAASRRLSLGLTSR